MIRITKNTLSKYKKILFDEEVELPKHLSENDFFDTIIAGLSSGRIELHLYHDDMEIKLLPSPFYAEFEKLNPDLKIKSKQFYVLKIQMRVFNFEQEIKKIKFNNNSEIWVSSTPECLWNAIRSYIGSGTIDIISKYIDINLERDLDFSICVTNALNRVFKDLNFDKLNIVVDVTDIKPNHFDIKIKHNSFFGDLFKDYEFSLIVDYLVHCDGSLIFDSNLSIKDLFFHKKICMSRFKHGNIEHCLETQLLKNIREYDS